MSFQDSSQTKVFFLVLSGPESTTLCHRRSCAWARGGLVFRGGDGRSIAEDLNPSGPNCNGQLIPFPETLLRS
jgi:hypothetical protein